MLSERGLDIPVLPTELIQGLQAIIPDTPTLVGLVVLVVALITYDVVWGMRSHRAFLEAMRTAPEYRKEAVRTRFLYQWAWQPWVLTLAALALVTLSPSLRFADVGLRLPSLGEVDGFARGLLIGAGVGLFGAVIAPVVIAWRQHGDRDEGAAPSETAHVNANVDPMLPTGRSDRRAWLLLSATAGITEEIMYRGVVLLTLSALLPAFDPLLICLVAVLLFGSAHAYQGWAGFATTSVVAVLFLGLYLGTASLLPGMVLHFAMDARGAVAKPKEAVPSAGLNGRER